MLLLALALAQPAHADLGPPPECPAGQHHEYLYGHRCVKDGYHLEAREGGGVEEVADTPADPAAAPSAEPTAPVSGDPAAPTVAEVPAAEPTAPAAPAAQETPRCAAASGRAAAWLALIGMGMALRRRRP